MLVVGFCYVSLNLLVNKNKQNNPQKNGKKSLYHGENRSQTYEAEKRVIRIPKNKLGSTLPLILEHELLKLKNNGKLNSYRLINERVNEAINEVETDLENNSIDKYADADTINNFLGKNYDRGYTFDIVVEKYIGEVLVRFKKDKKSKGYVFMKCLVRVQECKDRGNRKTEMEKLINAVSEVIKRMVVDESS